MDNDSDRISVDNEIENSISNINNITPDEQSLNESSCLSEGKDFEEPITRQRVVLDFTSNEDLDNDDVQRKCCEFWDFVKSRPELDCLIVNPKAETVPNTTKSNATISLPNHTSCTSIDGKEKTAVSVLEFVEEKGFISRAFRSRMPTAFCKEELKDYSDEQCISKARKEKKGTKKKNPQKQNTPKDASPLPTSPAVRNMCQMLDEWDLEHPKSMSPPGPVPDLHNSKLDSEIFP